MLTSEGTHDCFGTPIKPKYHDNIERHKFPSSRQKLNNDTAKTLGAYLRSAHDGLLLPRVAHETIVILWLIDKAGNCWFCLEEMYKSDAEISVFPRLDDVDYPTGYEKLGHPSLIGAGEARIAGEIIWSGNNGGQGNWIISNKSGRYGIRPDISMKHLINVREMFASHGIILEPHFISFQN